MSNCDLTTERLLTDQRRHLALLMNNNDQSTALTNLLETTAEIVACGPQCQKDKLIAERLKAYESAQVAMFTTTGNLENTAKSYYELSRSEEYSEEFLKKKIGEVADEIGAEYQKIFDKVVNDTQHIINMLSSNSKNYKNSTSYDVWLEKTNTKLDRNVKDTINEVTTNDRKSYYDNQEIDNLTNWYKLYYYLYIFILIVYFVCIWVVDSSFNFKIIVAIFLGQIAWFFYGKQFLVSMINGVKDSVELIPKNVHLFK
jgi:hypothetical protein